MISIRAVDTAIRSTKLAIVTVGFVGAETGDATIRTGALVAVIATDLGLVGDRLVAALSGFAAIGRTRAVIVALLGGRALAVAGLAADTTDLAGVGLDAESALGSHQLDAAEL